MKPVSSSSNIESIRAKEGFYLFTGSGSSMWPLIRDGIDTIDVRPVRQPLSVGEVVMHRFRKKLYRLVYGEKYQESFLESFVLFSNPVGFHRFDI